MNPLVVISLASIGLSMTLTSGCVTRGIEGSVVNPHQAGSVTGSVVGTVVGEIVGNVAGAVAGATEGAVTATAKSFRNEHRIIRTWKTEKTADGRTIKVPVDTEVDENGRPLKTS